MEQTTCAGAAYNGSGDTVAEARDFTASFLTRDRMKEAAVDARLVERARLVVSELVTNAVKYAQGPVSLMLKLSRDALVVAVSDTARAMPSPKPYDPGRVGQHGLEIVQALCRDLQISEQPGGKRLTARLGLHRPPLTSSPGADEGGPPTWPSGAVVG